MFVNYFGRILHNSDGTPAGGSTTDTGTAGTTTPASGATTSPPPAATFDWKTSGVDDAGMVTIQERGFKNAGDLLTSYRNLEKLTGVPPDRIVKIPGPKDDPKAWDDVFTKLGRPESADKYVIPVPDGDKGEFANTAKAWFHEAGVTQSQATKLAEKWNGHIAEQQKAQAAAIETRNTKEISELKQAWGADFETKAALVDRAAETFGMSQQQLDALKSSLGPKAAMEFLHNIGAKVGVESAKPAGFDKNNGNSFAMTPEQAQARLKEIRNDKTYSQLFNSKDPKQRQEARQEVERLTRIAYPGVTPVTASKGA